MIRLPKAVFRLRRPVGVSFKWHDSDGILLDFAENGLSIRVELP
jgi:hypothetical protein